MSLGARPVSAKNSGHAHEKGSRNECVDACGCVVEAGLAPNTERARRSDWSLFRAWCDEKGATGLPASPETVAAFVEAMAKDRRPASVRRYVASIAATHRTAGVEDTTKSKLVRIALRQMHRQQGRRQGQAHGLTRALLERLLKAGGNGLIDARNRALLSLAYDTLLRRSELVAVEVSDLVVERDGAATVLVRRSKSDPEGEGAQAFVARDSVGLVREWIALSGISGGKLFRSLNRGVVGERLHAGEVPRIFKKMARQAGLPPNIVNCVSGHSTRVGSCQDMVAHSIGTDAILNAGRWKTPTMVNRYAERLSARRSGAAQLARLQHRT